MASSKALVALTTSTASQATTIAPTTLIQSTGPGFFPSLADSLLFVRYVAQNKARSMTAVGVVLGLLWVWRRKSGGRSGRSRSKGHGARGRDGAVGKSHASSATLPTVRSRGTTLSTAVSSSTRASTGALSTASGVSGTSFGSLPSRSGSATSSSSSTASSSGRHGSKRTEVRSGATMFAGVSLDESGATVGRKSESDSYDSYGTATAGRFATTRPPPLKHVGSAETEVGSAGRSRLPSDAMYISSASFGTSTMSGSLTPLSPLKSSPTGGTHEFAGGAEGLHGLGSSPADGITPLSGDSGKINSASSDAGFGWFCDPKDLATPEPGRRFFEDAVPTYDSDSDDEDYNTEFDAFPSYTASSVFDEPSTSSVRATGPSWSKGPDPSTSAGSTTKADVDSDSAEVSSVRTNPQALYM